MSLLAQVFTVAIGAVATVVLARLLTPADFGLLAMVTPITGFFMLFADAGLAMATVQRAEINHRQVSSLFWLNVALGILLALLTLSLAPLLGWFYGDQRIVAIAAVVGTTFAVAGLSAQHQALLRRQMKFELLAIITVGSQLLSATVGVVAGVMGMSYWSLVLMVVSLPLFQLVLTWIVCSWRPSLPARDAGVGSMLAFGGWLTGFNVVNHFARNADNVLIGRVVGAASLGLYSKAYALLMLPISLIRNPLSRVTVPALSQLQGEPARYRRYLQRALEASMFLSAPLIGICWTSSETIIRLILGDQWLGAASVFRILALAALVQSFNVVTGWVYISLGRTRRWFNWAILSSSFIVLSFVVGLRWGINGVATSYAVANYLILVPSLHYCFKGSPVTVRDVGAVVWRPLGSAVASAILASLVIALIPHPLGVFGSFLLSSTVFLTVYLTSWWVLPGGRQALLEIWRILEEARLGLKESTS